MVTPGMHFLSTFVENLYLLLTYSVEQSKLCSNYFCSKQWNPIIVESC